MAVSHVGSVWHMCCTAVATVANEWQCHWQYLAVCSWVASGFALWRISGFFVPSSQGQHQLADTLAKLVLPAASFAMFWSKFLTFRL
jgi:hypothetical protein